jgi:hypothetical protein
LRWLNSADCGELISGTEWPDRFTRPKLEIGITNREKSPFAVLEICTVTLVLPAGLGDGVGPPAKVREPPQPINRKVMDKHRAPHVLKKYFAPEQ